MAFEVVLPKMGMTMVDGTITEWFVQDGDTVNEGDVLFAFETEKVDYEVTAESDGSLRIMQPVDSIVEAGGLVAYILAEGESASASTELTSGTTRRVEVAPGARDEQQAFRLVRDGAGVDAIDCTILQGIGPATEVRFTAEGGLVCLRW